jgi:phospholipid transport system substrate-binding protein
MKKMKFLMAFAMAALGLFASGIAMGKELISHQLVDQQCDSAQIQALLEERDAEIKELMGPKGSDYTDQQRNKLKDIINGIIDYQAMASTALGATYDTLSTEQRGEFVDVFSTIVRDQSLNKLDIYRAEVSYESIKVVQDSARVRTIAQLENVRTPVIYKMRNKGDEWVIVDMIIDDVSTADSYRRSFQNIIRKRGYDTLLESLKKRAERNT